MLLRSVRLIGKYGFTLFPDTEKFIQSNAALIQKLGVFSPWNGLLKIKLFKALFGTGANFLGQFKLLNELGLVAPLCQGEEFTTIYGHFEKAESFVGAFSAAVNMTQSFVERYPGKNISIDFFIKEVLRMSNLYPISKSSNTLMSVKAKPFVPSAAKGAAPTSPTQG